MAKGNFLTAFHPARLVTGKSRWYINIYYTDQKNVERHERPTFGLNRIINLSERRKRGEELVAKINWWLSQGYDFPFDERRVPRDYRGDQSLRPDKYETNIIDAFEFVVELRCSNSRPDSARGYKGIFSVFSNFLKIKKYDNIAVADFTRAMAVEFLDDLVVRRKGGARTYNNNLSHVKHFFNMLEDRGYRPDGSNPFMKIKRKKVHQKGRRNFTTAEARIIIPEIKESCSLLYHALLLQYACFIRPAELRRLKFGDIDLNAGYISLNTYQAKTHRARNVTIPTIIQAQLDEEFFNTHPSHWLIFGLGFKPHPTKECGRNTMNYKQNRILNRLVLRKQLDDITGLSWYSWKDTGITDCIYTMNPTSVQDQAGHWSVAETMRYKHQRKDNPEMRHDFPMDKLVK